MKKLEIKNIDVPQCGRSMIEMLGVLAIIGVLSVGGIAGYSKAMMKYRINKTIEQITLIAGNIRTFFAPQKDFTDLGTYSEPNITVVKKAKLVPDDMWTTYTTSSGGSGEYIENAWGGELEIYSSNSYYSPSFSIRVTDVTESICIELLSRDWKNIASGLTIDVWAEDTSWDVPIDVNKESLDIDDILEFCSSDDEEVPVSYIDFVFSK